MKTCLGCRELYTDEEQKHQHGRDPYCSLGCESKTRKKRGSKTLVTKPLDKGSYISANGYVMVEVSKSYNSFGYQLEHRVIMEKALGRRLTTNEHVHHKDGDRLNNDLSNLEVLTNAEHQRLHQLPQTQPRAARIPIVCALPGCGITKLVKAWLVDGRQHYCGNAHRLMAIHRAAKAYHASRRPPSLMCHWCAQAFPYRCYQGVEAKYCCKQHADAAQRLQIPMRSCEVCGIDFRPRPDARDTGRFCSEEHRLIGIAADWRGPKNPRRKVG